MIKNVLTLNESIDGNRIKQGDQSLMRYTLADTSNDNLELDGKKATVYLYTDKGVAYKQETTVEDNKVDVVITEIIPTGHYTLEIVVDSKFIFPSDNKTKIEVTSSVLGKGANEIEKKDLYNEIIDYGFSNNKFESLKGQALKYEDLTDRQKQELANYVPEARIIEVMEKDFLSQKGQLNYILIEDTHDYENNEYDYPINLVLFYDESNPVLNTPEALEDLKNVIKSYLEMYILTELDGVRERFKIEGLRKYLTENGIRFPFMNLEFHFDDNEGYKGTYYIYEPLTNLDEVVGVLKSDIPVTVSYVFNDRSLKTYQLEQNK